MKGAPPGPLPTPTIPTVEPRSVTAGDTWQWRRSVAAYPHTDDWILAYYLIGPGKLTAPVEGAEESGGGWLVTVTPAATADLVPGGYQLHGFVEQRDVDGVVTARRRIYEGPLHVVRDPATVTAPRRSHAEEMVELLTARLEGRVPADRESVTIDGTQITRIPIAEVRRLLNVYREELRIELGGPVIQSVVARDAL